MSFINNAHPGSQINLLCLIYRVLHDNPNKYTTDELQEFCAPEALFSSDDHIKRFKDTLSFWSKAPHQLWSPDQDKKLFLDLPVESNGFAVSEISHQLRHRLMAIDFQDILSEDDEFGASKAIRSFAYILTQDRFVILKSSLSTALVDECFSSNFGNYSLNNSEKSYFIEFCNFLGISEKVGSKDHLDPTRLLRSFLFKIFDKEKELSAIDFFKRLAKNVPILDNGKFNLIVREVIGAEIDRPNSLSINLSHALYRLREQRLIEFSDRSDDVGAVMLNLPSGMERQVSAISYLGGMA